MAIFGDGRRQASGSGARIGLGAFEKAPAEVQPRLGRRDRIDFFDRTLTDVADQQRQAALCTVVRRQGLDLLPWTPALRQWQARVMLLRQLDAGKPGEWPDLSDKALLASLQGLANRAAPQLYVVHPPDFQWEITGPLFEFYQRKHGVKFFSNALFPAGVPKPFYALVTPIELLSTFILRPVTLALRLLMNMIAGHLLLVLCFSATQYFFFEADGLFKLFGAGTLVFGFAFTIFEILVAVLQAYVFTLLTTVYIQLALADEH